MRKIDRLGKRERTRNQDRQSSKRIDGLETEIRKEIDKFLDLDSPSFRRMEVVKNPEKREGLREGTL